MLKSTKKKILIIMHRFTFMSDVFLNNLKDSYDVDIVFYEKGAYIKSMSEKKSNYLFLNNSETPSSIFQLFSSSLKLLKYLKNSKYEKILLVGGTLVYFIPPFLLTRLKNRELIVYRHDIDLFRPKPKITKGKFLFHLTSACEKYFMIRANKIIHKGLEKELEFLPYYARIKDRKSYLFREFLNPQLVQKSNPKKKLSKKTKIPLAKNNIWQ